MSLEVLKQGYKKIEFNPEFITVNNYENTSDGVGVKTITFVYTEPTLVELYVSKFYNAYSMREFSSMAHYSKYSKGFYVQQSKSVKMRKKRGSEDYSDNSMAAYNNIELTLDKARAIELFQEMVNKINLKAESELANEMARYYGSVSAYNLESERIAFLDKQLEDLNKTYLELRDRISEVKGLILEEKKTMATKLIESSDSVHDSFKPVLIEKISQEKIAPRYPWN